MNYLSPPWEIEVASTLELLYHYQLLFLESGIGSSAVIDVGRLICILQHLKASHLMSSLPTCHYYCQRVLDLSQIGLPKHRPVIGVVKLQDGTLGLEIPDSFHEVRKFKTLAAKSKCDNHSKAFISISTRMPIVCSSNGLHSHFNICFYSSVKLCGENTSTSML